MLVKHCLLVVDDEPDLVQSLQDLLRRDYRVLGANRASEGLKLMDKENVHVVMTDYRMPEMNGVEFLSILRDRYPDTTRLLFTAFGDLDTVVDAINQGSVYRYISKPLDPQELHVVLKQAVEHYDLLAERRRLLDELQEKNKRLEAANELQRGFIKVASHELRTPLTIILGLADLARHHVEPSTPLADWLGRIENASLRLNDRVGQIVKLWQAGNFDRTLHLESVDLVGLLQKAADDVRDFTVERKQTFTVDVPDGLGTVNVEEDKLRDSVVQLLINAIKFTPDGGTIRLSAKRLSNTVEIQVADNGVGIDAAAQQKIFEPFFTRFDVSKHCSGVYEFDRRGLGLGLTVVNAFVKMLGGRVTVESAAGKGSTFTIHLPS